MLFKVDENLHTDIAEMLRAEGHDAVSVHDQALSGHPDEEIGEVCRREGRVIVTQDLDFANIVAYPPEDYAGIIVLRLREPSRRSSLAAMRRILPLLTTEPLSGCLWTVDDMGIRIRQGGQP
ncbi:hypothetical protein OJF2_44480 [Aquisphaera giovannonii]|uniref:DUF5615 domain-containing protein n=1 Tax=Aquisphaera giovannonii TaxID=406548 RepID=A0A5B9W797_9BACT|nr:DUF5615 family PIN-like protein [Aquisphaera giovannonii]QEH35891.1 hypothetical protein OJF2_44480 [Aquisphaera giovannonii]